MNIFRTDTETESYDAWVSAFLFAIQRDTTIATTFSTSTEMSLLVSSELNAIHGLSVCHAQVCDVFIVFEMKSGFFQIMI